MQSPFPTDHRRNGGDPVGSIAPRPHACYQEWKIEGGVTAGIDFALVLAAEPAGEATAQAIQLSLEYAPAPPFDAGHPETAPAAVVAAVRAKGAAMRAERERLTHPPIDRPN